MVIKEYLHRLKKFILREYKRFTVAAQVKKEYNLHPVYDDEIVGINIECYWWNDLGNHEVNLGDYLSKIVVQFFAPKNGGRADKKTLFAIGSILGFRVQDAVVWGSGFLGHSYIVQYRAKYSKYDVRAVRGPKTREILRKNKTKCPEIYGDPGLLLPLLYKPNIEEKEYDATVISHYSHHIDIPNILQNKYIFHIESIKTKDYESFVNQIIKSKRVISNSLHGVIIAEAYGIPAVYLEKSNFVQFKFMDYYLGTDRHTIKFAKTVEEAMEMEPMPLPNVEIIQKRLLNAFPYDIWEEK